MTRYGMVIDATLCAGCDACTMACKDEYVGNDFPGYSAAQPDTTFGYYPGVTPVDSGVQNAKVWVIPGQKWMDRTEVVRGTFPNLKSTRYSIPCMMCTNAPCVKAAKNGDVVTRPDGIILIDPVLSYGDSNLPASCPYGKIYWNSVTNIPQKCTFCAHLVDQGKNPKCVDMCHMSAITFGDLDNPSSAIAKLVATGTPQALHPEYGTSPKVLYIGLPKTFIMGKVVDSKTGAYLQGAVVTATNAAGVAVGTSTVTNYGDFTIDGLASGSTYTLTVTLSAYATLTQSVNLATDTYVGNVQLVHS
jgi:Fe-S-cluster-containing dehydrogenase component